MHELIHSPGVSSVIATLSSRSQAVLGSLSHSTSSVGSPIPSLSPADCSVEVASPIFVVVHPIVVVASDHSPESFVAAYPTAILIGLYVGSCCESHHCAISVDCSLSHYPALGSGSSPIESSANPQLITVCLTLVASSSTSLSIS